MFAAHRLSFRIFTFNEMVKRPTCSGSQPYDSTFSIGRLRGTSASQSEMLGVMQRPMRLSPTSTVDCVQGYEEPSPYTFCRVVRNVTGPAGAVRWWASYEQLRLKAETTMRGVSSWTIFASRALRAFWSRLRATAAKSSSSAAPETA